MPELRLTLPTPEFAATVLCVFEELKRAQRQHPQWPTDNVKRAAIVLEEAGEVIREANRIDEGKSSLAALKMELIQTAAMCYRMLNAITDDEQEMVRMYGEFMGEH